MSDDGGFRVRIDGNWSAMEMGQLFSSSDTLYRALGQFHSRALHTTLSQEAHRPAPTGNSDGRENLLRVQQISFASPGWVDFVGLGEIVGHLKDLLLGIVDRVIERKDREQSRALTAASIEAATLENYAKYLEIIDKAFDLSNRPDLTDQQRQQLMQTVINAQRPIATQIALGKVVRVEDLKK